MRIIEFVVCGVLVALMSPALAQHAHHTPEQHRQMLARQGEGAAPGMAVLPARTRAQLDAVRLAVQKYRDVEVARREGWVRFGQGEPPLMGEHWYRKGAREPLPGEPFDPAMPSNLQYATIDGRRELVGVSYVVRLEPGMPLPDGFAGAYDHWHVHDVLKIIAAATEERPLLRWLANGWLDRTYFDTGDRRSQMAMVHAWVVTPNPDGVFADDNRVLPYLRAGLPASYADGADRAAALGVELIGANGCAQTIEGDLWIAQASGAQKRALRAACAQASERVRAVRAAPATALNREAKAAWEQLESAKRDVLSEQQMTRIASITEHPMSHAGH